jgi:hypothetical protein
MKLILGLLVMTSPIYILLGWIWYSDGFTPMLKTLTATSLIVIGVFTTTTIALKIMDII